MNQAQLGVSVTEYHTAGEPFRIITGGIPPIKGATVLQKRRYAHEHLDHLRRLVINEPRGHADMYGCFLVDPVTEGAAFGTLFFHNEGYSTACGHGTIALATWAVEHGIVPVDAGASEATITIDVPSGPVQAIVGLDDGRVTSVRFRNVPAFVHSESVTVSTSRGDLVVDIAFGGAFYAMLDLGGLNLHVNPADLNDLIALGREIKADIERRYVVEHPEEPELRDVYGVIFYQDEPDVDGRLCQRNVTVFADGEVDRSPCGSGTSTRLATLTHQKRLAVGDSLVHRSIIDTEFVGTVVASTSVAGKEAYLTEVLGHAYLTGTHYFVLSPHDDLGTGFVLR